MSKKPLAPVIVEIRAQRKRLRVSQVRLAELAGVTSKYLSLLETGQRANPSYELVVKMQGALERIERERAAARPALKRGRGKARPQNGGVSK
jgi:predicted transcriptional regulator